MHRGHGNFIILATLRPSGAVVAATSPIQTCSKLSPLRCYFHPSSARSTARPSGLYILPMGAARALYPHARTILSSSTYYTIKNALRRENKLVVVLFRREVEVENRPVLLRLAHPPPGALKGGRGSLACSSFCAGTHLHDPIAGPRGVSGAGHRQNSTKHRHARGHVRGQHYLAAEVARRA